MNDEQATTEYSIENNERDSDTVYHNYPRTMEIFGSYHLPRISYNMFSSYHYNYYTIFALFVLIKSVLVFTIKVYTKSFILK